MPSISSPFSLGHAPSASYTLIVLTGPVLSAEVREWAASTAWPVSASVWDRCLEAVRLRMFPLPWTSRCCRGTGIRRDCRLQGRADRGILPGSLDRGVLRLRRTASRKLDQLDAATRLSDLARPGNRLKPLKGRRKGRWSIRINDQWRICFRWPDGSPGPTEVEIVDYH